MSFSSGMTRIPDELTRSARDFEPIHRDLAALVLSPELDVTDLIALARTAREKFFGRKVQVHILNNIRNGHCPEDCGYCAQRKTAPKDSIAAYPEKSEEEILMEAERAYRSGAFRYCMVSAGRGPSEQSVARLAGVIRKIKARYPLQICLSAGILKQPELAVQLAEAGLDRYNHNLNTSADFYPEIATTHTFADREDTLEVLTGAGISLCSGVIAGMGETPADLAGVAVRLCELGVESIPVNFFIPVPGHALREPLTLTPEYCLRLLVMFRLTNPRAEIRMAAGRELHLKERQAEGLAVANSLFVSGYLNVKGSPARETLALVLNAGYELDLAGSDRPGELGEILATLREEQALTPPAANAQNTSGRAFFMKELNDLRPFRAPESRS